jgi:cell division protein FtsN
MKSILIISISTILLFGCRSGREVTFDGGNYQEQAATISDIDNTAEKPIIIKEEVVVAVENYPQIKPNEIYFVILGSFRVLNNAKNFQKQIGKDGFNSQLLQNEQGLYRVSVSTFTDEGEARNMVYSIRKKFAIYSDVWLLRRQS